MSDKEEKPPERYVATTTVGTDVIESVIFNKVPAFLVFNGKDFNIQVSYPTISERLLPLQEGMYPYRPLNLTNALLEKIKVAKPKLEQVYKAVYKEFDTFLDLERRYKILLSATVLESYQQHKIEETGYPYFYGDNDSGKTRGLEILALLCYRALETVDMSSANIYGYIGTRSEGNCTILEDEVETLSKNTDREKLAIFRSGYRKGKVVARTVDASTKARTQQFHKTFCVKAFTGLYVPYDKGFRQRLIPIPMVWGMPKKDKIEEKDREKMDMIRLMLLVLRMRHYFYPLPKVNIKLSGRMRELWESKLQVTAGLSIEKEMCNLALQVRNDKKEVLRQSPEAYIARAVLFHYRRLKGAEISFTDIWKRFHIVIGEKWGNKRKIDSDLLGFTITKDYVGRRLKSIFSGEPHNRYMVGRTWKFDKERIEKLTIKFGLTDEDISGVEFE